MRSYGPKKRTVAEKEAACLRFLYECYPQALQTVTVDQLVARHGVSPKYAEYNLLIARQKRA